MSERATTEGARLVVTLDAEASEALVEEVVRLAARLEQEMLAVFVEDSALLASAALPFTRMISARTTEESAFDLAGTRRALKVLAERARQKVAQRAATADVRWSFRVGSDDLSELGLGAADVVALTPSLALILERAATAAVLPCPVVLSTGRDGPVLLVYEGSDVALELGLKLASREAAPLTVLAVGADRAAAEERAAAASRRLGEMSAEVVPVDGDEPEASVGEFLRERRPRLVVLDNCGGGRRWWPMLASLKRPRRRAGP